MVNPWQSLHFPQQGLGRFSAFDYSFSSSYYLACHRLLGGSSEDFELFQWAHYFSNYSKKYPSMTPLIIYEKPPSLG